MAEHQAIHKYLQLGEPLSGLINSYQALRAPQALLVSGPFGVGKEELCRLLAMTLLCESDNRPCTQCAECSKARHENHPNLLVVSTQARQKTVKVEQARQLLNDLSTYPFQSGRRVVLLLLVDTFTIQAQNALLKSIEEPDQNTFFILIAQQEKAVLSTIRSRCRHVRFPLWPTGFIVQQLVDEGVPLKKAQKLAALSGGSPGRAKLFLTDPKACQVQQLAEETFLSVRKRKDVAAASCRLKDAKDLQEQLFDYLENAAAAMINRSNPSSKENLYAQRLIQSVLTARKYRASNVSWQAVADMILLNILEDT